MCLPSLHERYVNFYTDYATKNLATLMERPVALQDAVFERFFQQAEIAQFTPEEQRDYRESQKDFWDFCSVTETYEKKGLRKGMEKGLKEGMEKGRAEGRDERTLEIASSLKAAGMDIQFTALHTGLSPSKIEAL